MAARTPSTIAGSIVPLPGRMTTTTPAKPAATASQRRRRIRSPRIGTESAVMKSWLD